MKIIGQIQAAGLDINQGLMYTGGEDNYISAVQRFYKSYTKNLSKIRDHYINRNYNDYMISIHALKSNAKMIGAGMLSRAFEELEMAAKAGDIELVETKNAPVLQMYEKLIERLKPIGESEEVHPADEISGEEAREVAMQLVSALDDFDDNLAKELAEKLSGYPFRINQREKLKEAAGYIDDFMYKEANDIIHDIYPAIE